MRRAPFGERWRAATKLGWCDIACAACIMAASAIFCVMTLQAMPEMRAAARGEGVHGVLHVEEQSCGRGGCDSLGTFRPADGSPGVPGMLEEKLTVGRDVVVQYFPASGTTYRLPYLRLHQDVGLGVGAGLVALGIAGWGLGLVALTLRDRRRVRRLFPDADPRARTTPRRPG